MCDLVLIDHEVLNCHRLTSRCRFGSLLLTVAFFTVFLTEAHAAQVNDIPTSSASFISATAIEGIQDTILAKNAKIYLQVDRAKIIRLPTETRTVIIGNPMVADISTLRDGMGILTAKSYGTTNLIILDEKGGVLLEALLVGVVASSEDAVVVQRGLERETFSCSPICQPAIQLGDSSAHFNQNSQQSTTRQGLAVAK